MSLESALADLSAKVAENTAALNKLLSAAPAATAAAAEASAAPAKAKATKAAAAEAPMPAAEAPAEDGPTLEELKAAFGAWLKAVPQESDERKARNTYLRETLFVKLKIKELAEAAPKQRKALAAWLKEKAPSDLLGYGPGVFAAPVAEEAEDDEGDEDDL